MATGATWGDGNPYTMATGFDPASIATNLGSLVAAKLSSTLVSQVVLPHYPEGAAGQQIGASVGATLARPRQGKFAQRATAKTRRGCRRTPAAATNPSSHQKSAAHSRVVTATSHPRNLWITKTSSWPATPRTFTGLRHATDATGARWR
jgi:hypothetical protein